MGFRVAVTRQNAGRSASGLPTAGVNVPAVTTSARVMVVCGRLSAARPSQLLAKAGTAPNASAVKVKRCKPGRSIFTPWDKRKVY